jgi:hypothetical protein
VYLELCPIEIASGFADVEIFDFSFLAKIGEVNTEINNKILASKSKLK